MARRHTALITPTDPQQLADRGDQLAAAVDAALRKVANRAARKIRNSAPLIAAGSAYVSPDDLNLVATDWETVVDGQLLPMVEELYTGASLSWTAAAAAAMLGRDRIVIPPVSSRAAETYLANARNRLVGIGNQLWQDTRTALLEGFQAGEDIPALARRVSAAAGVTGPRATVIARTEVVSASNAGSIDTARLLAETGVAVEKIWMSTPDGRTRPSHMAADGQQVPIDQPFDVGGAALDFPGDPAGPAEEIISCRCALGWDIPDEIPPTEAAALVAAGEDHAMPSARTSSARKVKLRWTTPPNITATTTRPPVLTAADGEQHTGAMVALVPSREDAGRLAIDGGEAADELHVTLFYLGDGADFTVQDRGELAGLVREQVAGLGPVEAEAFGVSVFNPHTDERETAHVLTLSSEALDAAHRAVLAAVDGYAAALPVQHTPWHAHMTIAYDDDLGVQQQLTDRLGPVLFDRIRLAFAGETTDIPLADQPADEDDEEEPAGEEEVAATSPAATSTATTLAAVGVHDTATSDESWDGPANEARLPSPMPVGTARAAYGWIEDGRVEDGELPKDACRFIHHNVSTDGRPGAANLTACSTGIGVLNGGRGGTNIPASDRQGTYDHLAAHLRDAGREPPPLTHDQGGEHAAVDGAPVDVAALAGQQRVTLQDEGPCPAGTHPMPDGTCMPDEDMPGGDVAAVGEHFHTLMIIEGVSTGLRTFAEGALTWRIPPFSLRWQEREPEMGGHALAVGVGNIERVERLGGVEIHGWGRLDLDDEDGLEFARKLASGFAPWVSIGLDESLKESDVELVFPDDGEEADEEEEAEGLLMLFAEPEQVIFHAGRIAELTAVTVPAQAEARIEALPALYEALAQRGIQVEAPPTQRAVVVASAAVDEVATITIPHVPPAWWFDEPTDVTPLGALTITDDGRVYGWLATDGVAHRAFRDRRVEAPMGRVDYSRWMGTEALVAGGGRVVAGPITMECGHLPPTASRSPERRMEHYENACSVVAKARVGESFREVDGVTRRLAWVAGAMEPFVTGDQISRMLACRLSGDWAPHPERPGWQELVAMLVVPVPGFANTRSGPSVRVKEGALVASAVPIRLASGHRAGPDTRPVLERMARVIGRDRSSRMRQLHARVHRCDNGRQEEGVPA